MEATRRRTWRQWLIAQWRDGLSYALLLFVILRFAFSLIALVEGALAPVWAPCTYAAPAPILFNDGIAFLILGIWQRADGCTYEWIAAVGYAPEDLHRFAFFPLYPLLLRLVSPLLANLPTLSGMVVSGVAYIAGVTGLYRLVRRDFDTPVARRAVLYLSIFPSAFFLFAPFTESLFLACSVWALYAARREAWVWAGLLGLFAALTRAQGLFLLLPLAWEAWCAFQRHRDRRQNVWPLLVAPSGPICGFLLYNLYTWQLANKTVLQAQEVWGMRMTPPWKVLADSWRYIVARGSFLEAINLALILGCTLLLLIGLRRIPLSYSLIAAPQLLLLLSRESYLTPLTSASRYLLVLFPIFVIMALPGWQRWVQRAWVTLSLALLFVLLVLFLGGPFVA